MFFVYFDFDCTLTCAHYHYYLNLPSVLKVNIPYSQLDKSAKMKLLTKDFIIEYFFGIERFGAIEALLHTLKKSMSNIYIFIVTKGVSEDVKFCLEKVGLLHYFDAIYDTTVYGSKEEIIKNNAKNNVKKLFQPVNQSQFNINTWNHLYIDDDPSSPLKEIQLITLPFEGGGITIDQCQTIIIEISKRIYQKWIKIN